MEPLTAKELNVLAKSVFSPTEKDHALAVLIDFPDERIPDTPAWRARRILAWQWVQALKQSTDCCLEHIDLIGYANVRNNNADLPQEFYKLSLFDPDWTAHNFKKGKAFSQPDIFSAYPLILAPTQFSATAPLKLLAKTYQFRAATMPGFSPDMISALRLDYRVINERVHLLKNLLDQTDEVHIQFHVGDAIYTMRFDTRFRTAHASGGRFPEPGTAGNLPSGECYIVPYEGELEETSQSHGLLPVQLGDEVVVYQIEKNKAVDVISQGPMSDSEREYIHNEPAYANISEIGLGVLKDFGVQNTGEILLDEKLGLHIAFGRSDHFGGSVGVKDFSSPDAVVHIDRIYIPETMPKVHVDFVNLVLADRREMLLMEDGRYLVF